MADTLPEGGLDGAIISIEVGAKPAGTVVTGRPRKLGEVYIHRILQPGENLIAWGSTAKTTYFAVDEHMVRLVFFLGILLFSVSAIFHAISYHLDCIPQFRFFSALIAIGAALTIFLWITLYGVRHSNYILTDKRLIYLGTFAYSYDLNLFERSLVHTTPTGLTFIELWQKNGQGPAIILQLGENAEQIVSAFPQAIAHEKSSP